MIDSIVYRVPGMYCHRCEAAVSEELGHVRGADGVRVDVQATTVTVQGRRLEDAALRAAIDETVYAAK